MLQRTRSPAVGSWLGMQFPQLPTCPIHTMAFNQRHHCMGLTIWSGPSRMYAEAFLDWCRVEGGRSGESVFITLWYFLTAVTGESNDAVQNKLLFSCINNKLLFNCIRVEKYSSLGILHVSYQLRS